MPILRSGRKTVLITMGDPSGVGPEVILKSLASPRVKGLADFLIIGDRFVIDKVKKDLSLSIKVNVLEVSGIRPKSFSYGKISKSSGRASFEYIEEAVRLLKNGVASTLVTGPVSKSSVRASCLRHFQGHTEYLAERSHVEDFAMMFIGKRLKVSLVTRHISIKNVPRTLSAESIYKTIVLTGNCLKNNFGIKNPRIGVCGLNPHAGEGGSFGKEESSIIAPAVRKASSRFRYLSGPYPADTLFYSVYNGKFDAAVAMYHDQALGPFKMLYFNNGVNLTLGLPFIRTSPDHGTAFNIAGKGIADPSSMIEAILLACRLSGRRSDTSKAKC